jgi:hypothetical protein
MEWVQNDGYLKSASYGYIDSQRSQLKPDKEIESKLGQDGVNLLDSCLL